MLRKMIIAIAAIAVFGGGCFFPAIARSENGGLLTAQQHENEATGKPAISKQTEGKENVGNKFCPVSGKRIDEKTKATYEYKGRIYNFCCLDCIEEFKKNPEKYIEKMNKEKSGTSGQRHSGHEEHN